MGRTGAQCEDAGELGCLFLEDFGLCGLARRRRLVGAKSFIRGLCGRMGNFSASSLGVGD